MTVEQSGHMLLAVGDRRWCLCCDLFQMRRPPEGIWPWLKVCPRNTAFAQTMIPTKEPPMEITLKPTSSIVPINEAPTRIWKGHTKTGIEVVAFIAVIGAPAEKHSAEFLAQLADHVVSRECNGALPADLELAMRLGR